MASECRAKDPSSCRVHGTGGSFEKFQAIADAAAVSGDVDLYIKTRAKIDSIEEKMSYAKLNEAITEEAVEAAAHAEWDFVEADGTSWEEVGEFGEQWKIDRLRDTRGSLEAAQRYMPFGTVTDLAVEETARYNYEYRDSGFHWNTSSDEDRAKYRREALASLEAAAPHMPKQTTKAVRTVLGRTYDRFGFHRETKLVNDIISVMDDPSKRVTERDRDASPAAEYVRERLWNNYSGGGASASATADLFHALGREKELGWVVEQVPGYRYFPQYFSNYITE